MTLRHTLSGAAIAAVIAMATTAPALADPFTGSSITNDSQSSGFAFSALHSVTPQGSNNEILYRITDSPVAYTFDQALGGLQGSTITFDNTQSYGLVGTNSADGNTGLLTLFGGAQFTVGAASGAFSGSYDRDGLNGPGTDRVTPTHLISGASAFRIQTFDSGGGLLTDDVGSFIFNETAMGPFNGFYGDAIGQNAWLWGASQLALESSEFDRLGIDFAWGVTPSSSSSSGGQAPEPVGLALLGVGFAGIGLVRRRRSHA